MLYLRLDAAIGQRNADRKDAAFDVGYEWGLVEGRARRPADAVEGELGDRLIELLTTSEVDRERRLAVLLEVAAGLAGDRDRAHP